MSIDSNTLFAVMWICFTTYHVIKLLIMFRQGARIS